MVRHPPSHEPAKPITGGRVGLVWVAGLLVAVGAGVATAHGLYEVALAAGVPRVLGWLYPLITDGLALVAYATTTRLAGQGRRYAWSVVVIAAGLSGLTQASYLAGSVAAAPPVLRFAIGAWPALAAAIVAHLLYLLAGHHDPGVLSSQELPTGVGEGTTALAAPESTVSPTPAVASVPSRAVPGPRPLSLTPEDSVGPLARSADEHPPPQPVGHPVDTELDGRAQVGHRTGHPIGQLPGPVLSPPVRLIGSPAGDRALTLAREHAARHGRLPTVRELASLARVARGTAAAALKDLRSHPQWATPGEAASNARRHP